MRALRLALFGLLAAAMAAVALGAASHGPTGTLVEGHTTFVTFANFTNLDGNVTTAAAVAVLVREIDATPTRFAGVLWFNDQYLVNPDSSVAPRSVRHPCTGVVLATERGNADPRGPMSLGAATYVESYHITDPNDRSWDVDKWRVPSGNSSYLVWVAPILNNQVSSTTPDDGSACSPITDLGCPTPEASCARAPGSVEACLPDACDTIRYNAVLFMEVEDLVGAAAPKNHSIGSTDRQQDWSGCHDAHEDYGCPDGDDDREGNSHAYWPGGLIVEPEGYTADCSGDGRVDESCHRTADVDIYYGTAPMPLARKYALYDVSGAGEAYGCTYHSGIPGLC